MDRLRRAALLTRLIELLRQNTSWCGETHIQKAAYFAQGLLRIPMGYDFILYKHGPFSFDLRDELTAFRADGLLKLEPKWPRGARIAPTKQSKYIQGLYPRTMGEYEGAIQFVASSLGGKGVVELERLTTALYVSELLEDASVRERAECVISLKPHIPRVDAVDAVRELDRVAEEAPVPIH